MEVLFGILTSVVQLAVLGGIVWAIARAVGRRGERDEAVDTATSVRRLFVYTLLFATLVVAATGVTLVLTELGGDGGGRADDDRAGLALGLAFGIVAAPAYALLLRHARRRLRDTSGERESFAWSAYLNASLLTSLVITTVAAQQLLESVTGVDDFEISSVAPFVVWAVVWAGHWFWLRASYGLTGDADLAAGSLAGLVPLAIGIAGIAYVVGDEVYTRVVERVPVGHDDPDLRSWAIATVVGGAVWGWHWLARYATAERTTLWHVYVVLLGALGGLVAAVVSAATLAYSLLVWFLGDPSESLPSRHFEYVPVAAAILATGALAWRYHHRVLARQPETARTEPLRAYDYLVAAAGLTASVVGATIALAALIESVTPEGDDIGGGVANQLLLACTLVAIGGPLWAFFWSQIRHHAAASPADELGSMVRRLHLIVVFGVGGIVVLGSLIAVLFVGFEDLLDGAFGAATVRDARVGIALVVTVTGVAWYHLGVFRADREALGEHEATLPPPPLAPPMLRVLLVGPPETPVAAQLATALPARVDLWARSDRADAPAIDIDELADRIRATNAANVLVLLEPDRTAVVPFEAPGEPAAQDPALGLSLVPDDGAVG